MPGDFLPLLVTWDTELGVGATPASKEAKQLRVFCAWLGRTFEHACSISMVAKRARS